MQRYRCGCQDGSHLWHVWGNPESEPTTLYAADDDADNDVYCKGLARYDEVIVSGARDLSPNKHIN